MNIGLIGAGNIGGALARNLKKRGHDVVIANSRGPESLQAFAAEIGVRAVTAREAAQFGEVVVVTIPQKNVPTLQADLFADVPSSTVVVDTGNYYPRHRDGAIPEIENGMPESQWVEQQLGRPVVKAFNNIYALHLLEHGKPKGASDRKALPVAGDDARAKAIVMDLIDQLGFDPVDAGSLAESWRQQPATPIYGLDPDAAGARAALAAASPERLPEWRATEKSPGDFENPA